MCPMATLLEPISNRKALCGTQDGTSVHPGPTLCPLLSWVNDLGGTAGAPQPPLIQGEYYGIFLPTRVSPLPSPASPYPICGPTPCLPPRLSTRPPATRRPPSGPSHGKANSVCPGSARGPAESPAKPTFLEVRPSLALPSPCVLRRPWPTPPGAGLLSASPSSGLRPPRLVQARVPPKVLERSVHPRLRAGREPRAGPGLRPVLDFPSLFGGFV